MKRQTFLNIFMAFCLILQMGVHAAPLTLSHTITSYNNQSVSLTLQLTRVDLRGPEFELLKQEGNGAYTAVTPVDERSYIGTVDGYPDAIAGGVQKDNGEFWGTVIFDGGSNWLVKDDLAYSAGLQSLPDFYTYPAWTVSGGRIGTKVYSFDVAVDADNTFFTDAGSSVATAFEQIEQNIAMARAMYMRDAMLRPRLARVIIRGSSAHDPVTGTTGTSAALNAIQADWLANHGDASRDTIAGLTATMYGGGLATGSSIGEARSISVNGGGANFFAVFRHELGHNWSLFHYMGDFPEGATFMSGNTYARFSGPELENTLDHRNDRSGYLDIATANFSMADIPPYACIDKATSTQNSNPSVTIDVMANDHDANGDTSLIIDSFDSQSARGGTISQVGTGTYATLEYTPASDLLGTDWFAYKLKDTDNLTATGIAVISIDTNDDKELKGHWRLDETSGTAMSDASICDSAAKQYYIPYNNRGSITVGQSGKYGKAVKFNGDKVVLKLEDTVLGSNYATITAWIKRDGSQVDHAGIVMNKEWKSSGTGAGLKLISNQVAYIWNGQKYGYTPSLLVPDNEWTFCALVIEPTKATFYMKPDSGSLQTDINTGATHVSRLLTGTTSIGWDPHNNDRQFKGLIDDVRIYRGALTQSEIEDIIKGGGAENSRPFNGSTDISTDAQLKWVGGSNMSQQNIYLGTNPGSLQYQASTTGVIWSPSLQPDTTYHWRVDTITPAGTITGRVWSFTTRSPECVGLDYNLNDDCTVDLSDFAVFSQNWGVDGGYDLSDLLLFATEWLSTGTWQ